MRLVDLVSPSDLEAAVDAGLVSSRVHPDDRGVCILNYTDKAMYTPGAWDNPAVRQCRGLIVRDGHVIARPWAKFFNYGQPEAGVFDLSAAVETTDKLDGSLGIIYPLRRGGYAVATRGSFTSEQAIHATGLLQRMLEDNPDMYWPHWYTPLVEIVYPRNRVVVDYGDRDELVLLGGVTLASGLYDGPTVAKFFTNWRGSCAQSFPYRTLADALSAPPRPNAEGLCVRFLDEPSRIVKIKQADYVELHRIVTGLSERTVWQHMVDGRPLGDLLGPLPDELHAWAAQVWDELGARADELLDAAQVAHEFIVAGLDPKFERREYAAQAKKYPDLTPYLFALLDGRDPYPRILKTLKPSGATRARTFSEETA